MSFLPYGRESEGGWVAAFGGSLVVHAAILAGLMAAWQAHRAAEDNIDLAGLPPVIIEELDIRPPPDPITADPPVQPEPPPPPEITADPPPPPEVLPVTPPSTATAPVPEAPTPAPDAPSLAEQPSVQTAEPPPEPLPPAEDPPPVEAEAERIEAPDEAELDVVLPTPPSGGAEPSGGVAPAPPSGPMAVAQPSPLDTLDTVAPANGAVASPDSRPDPAAVTPVAPGTIAVLEPIPASPGGVLTVVGDSGTASLDGAGGGAVDILAPVSESPPPAAVGTGIDAVAEPVAPPPPIVGDDPPPADSLATVPSPGAGDRVAAIPPDDALPSAGAQPVAAGTAAPAPQALNPVIQSGTGAGEAGATPLSPQDNALLDLIVAVGEVQRDRRCVIALPRRVGGDQVGLLMAAAEESAMADFLAELSRLFPDFVPPQIERVLVDARQCAALDFVATNADYPGARLGLQVGDRVLNSGEVLRGFVVGDPALERVVVIVDDNGVVHDLDRFLRTVPNADNALRFDAPLTRRTGTRETHLLLIALAAPDGLDAIRALDGRLATDVFPALPRNLASRAQLATSLIELR